MASLCASQNPPVGCIAIPVHRRDALCDVIGGESILKPAVVERLKEIIRQAYPGLEVYDSDSSRRFQVFDPNDEDDDSKGLLFTEGITHAFMRPDLIAGKPNLREDLTQFLTAEQAGGRRRRSRKTRKTRKIRNRKTRNRRHR